MLFLIFGKMLGLNIDTSCRVYVSDTFISACKTATEISLAFLIPASLISLECFWFVKTVSNSLSLAVLILAFLTNVHIRWTKEKGVFF